MINIQCGDYKDLITDLKNESIDLVITDPPFLHVKGGEKSKFNKGKMAKGSELNTKLNSFDKDNIYHLLNSLKRLFKNNSYNAYFYCSKLQIPYYLNYALENKYNFDILIYDRDKKGMISTKFYASNIDYIIRIYGKGRGLNNIGDIKNKADYYQKIKRQKQPNTYGHPTEKPVEHIKEMILVSSNENDVILDCFMGVGTTAVACLETNRNFIGYEIDENYYNVTLKRLKEKGE